MDFDASTLVYIVAVIVYFIYSNFFNKKQPEQTGQAEEVGRPEEPEKAMSFDDLLKEIRREQGERERDLEGTTIEEGDYVEEEAYVTEPAPTPKKYFTYEDPEQYPRPEGNYQSTNNSYEKQPLVKLDDQVDLYSDEKILGEVEDISGYTKGKNKYADILKNPETVKDAIVVSEILRPKYF